MRRADIDERLHMQKSAPNRPSPSKRETSPLQLLKALSPPQTLIHIGAGSGQGELHHWHTWGVPQVLLVDADAERLAWAESMRAANPGWHVSASIVCDVDDTVTYHQASNPAEDGLIPAEPLRSLWPNLQAAGQVQRAAQRLDTLLAQAAVQFDTSHGNTWLLVDCLPALPILQGGTATLGQCTVISVRALLQSFAGVNPGADLAAIEGFLQGHGFKWVDTRVGHQPAIGHALFVRDQQAALEAQTRQWAYEKTQLIAEIAKRTGELADLLAQRDAETAAKTEALAQRDTLTTEKADLAAQLSAQTQLAVQRQADLTAIQAHTDQLAQEKANLMAAHADLTRATAELTAQRDAEANAKAEAQAQLAAQIQLAAERQAGLTALQAQGDQLAQEKTNLMAAHADLTRATAELTAQRDAEANAKAEAQAQLAAQIQLAAERQAGLTALQAQGDQLAQEKTNLMAAHADLTRAAAELTAQRDAEANAKAEAQAQLAAQIQLAAERQVGLTALQAQGDQLAQEKANLMAAHADLTRATAELTAQRDAEANAKAEAQAQLAAQIQLAAERQAGLTALQAQGDQLAQEKANLMAAHADLTRATAELTAQRDAEAQAKAAAIAQLEVEAKARTESEAQRDALAVQKTQLTTAKDEQTQLATQRQQALTAAQQDITNLQHRIQQLEGEAAQTAYRQQLQQEEMIKAEAQIELIKDLLLREPGL
jgi:hypothetical protein